jgi:ADP-heptose:LPS heptosyltransferase
LKRALVVRAGALGDILLLRRAVFALRRAAFESTLLAPRASGAVLVGPGESEVASLIEWNRTDVAALFDDTAAVSKPLRTDLRAFDLALVCSRGAALRGQLGALVPRVVAIDPTPPAGTHAARWYAGALAPLGIADDAEPAPLRFTPEERAHADAWRVRLPAAFLAIHPGSGSEEKNWPAGRFAALARALSPDRPWLLVAGPADREGFDALSQEPGAVCARELPPRILGALLARAGLFVGNDSGVTHLAAAGGAPTLALFGPTDPLQWAPVGARAAALRSRDGRMTGLDTDEVLAAATSCVNERRVT